jgi:hypothetical protein
MSDPPWVPLGRRTNPPAEAEVLYEGIPEHLAEPLWRWIELWVSDPGEILLALRPGQGSADDPWSDLTDAAFQDEGLFLDVIELLWQGQSDRHGGSAPTVPIPAQVAPMAVHLAATLGHWFSSGAVRNKS